MMRSIYTKTLYQKRFFILGWSVGLIALTIFTVLFFPMFTSSDIAKSFDQLPDSMKSIAGDASSFETLENYVTQQVFIGNTLLIILILTIMMFSSLTAGEEQRKTLETQLSLPLRRRNILFHKLLAGLSIIMVAGVAICGSILAGAAIINEPYGTLTAIQQTVVCLLVGVGYGMLAFMLGAWTGRRGVALGIASAVGFASYILHALSTTAAVFGAVDKFTLFYYFQPGSMELIDWTVLLVVPTVLALLAFVGFAKRDLKG